MLFDIEQERQSGLGDTEQPWSVCTAKKWVKADKLAVEELYKKYSRDHVHDVLKAYASAKAAGMPVPDLVNPRTLLFNWREINVALERCAVPSFHALEIALAEGKPTMARVIELGLRARERWQRAVVVANETTLNPLPCGPLVRSFLSHYLERMPPSRDFICNWIRRTSEPWHHRHPWYILDGTHMALAYCGNGDTWWGMVAHVERHLAG